MVINCYLIALIIAYYFNLIMLFVYCKCFFSLLECSSLCLHIFFFIKMSVRFYKKLKKNRKYSINNIFLSDEKYKEILNEVSLLKDGQKKKKNSRDYWLLQRYLFNFLESTFIVKKIKSYALIKIFNFQL